MTRWIPSLGLLAAACTMTLATAPARAAEAEPALTITRVGSVPSVKGAVPANFTGAVRVDMLHAPQAPWHAYRTSSYLGAMVSDTARGATVRVLPRRADD